MVCTPAFCIELETMVALEAKTTLDEFAKAKEKVLLFPVAAMSAVTQK